MNEGVVLGQCVRRVLEPRGLCWLELVVSVGFGACVMIPIVLLHSP